MLLLFLLIITVLIYFYVTKNHDYWAKRNVKHDKPIPLFGNYFRSFFGKISITNVSIDFYKKYSDEKVVGYYKGTTPVLIVRDLEIVRRILTADFGSFYARGLGRDPDIEPLMLSLFHIDGDKWKLLRQRLTSAFTTGKLKAMFPLIIACAEKLQKVTEQLSVNKEEYDVRELMARYTTEFIGACGFGIEMDSIDDENSQFRNLGRFMFQPELMLILRMGLNEVLPELVHKLRIHVGKKALVSQMNEIVDGICKQRNYKPIGRNDFVDLLLDLNEKVKLEGESVEKRSPDGKPEKVEMNFDFKCIVAQIFVFFGAGFETSSSATSFTLHQLAYNPEIQKKVQQEIDEVLSRHNNQLSYDAISEMTYLDMAFKESMRMFPSLGVLNRVCARKYTIPGTDVTIDPGVRIVIPVQAIQNDENYYDCPEEFRPERFRGDEVKNRHKFAYLPFGEGPRACIGERLGHMQSLAGLAAVLQKFTFEPSKSSRRHLEVNQASNVVQAVKHGVPLKICKRK